jgi:hypothetical protein
VVGRGESDWLADPAGYALPQYVADMVVLLARLNARTIDWVGTSMGGLIGLALASLPGTPLQRLVLNDVGPSIEPEALQRIAAYVGQSMRFASVEEGARAIHAVSGGFGSFSEAEWLALNRPMFKPDGEAVRLHYDPAIANNLRADRARAQDAAGLFTRPARGACCAWRRACRPCAGCRQQAAGARRAGAGVAAGLCAAGQPAGHLADQVGDRRPGLPLPAPPRPTTRMARLVDENACRARTAAWRHARQLLAAAAAPVCTPRCRAGPSTCTASGKRCRARA